MYNKYRMDSGKGRLAWQTRARARSAGLLPKQSKKKSSACGDYVFRVLFKQEYHGEKGRDTRYRSWIEILMRPVPYDAMISDDNGVIPNIANLNGFDKISAAVVRQSMHFASDKYCTEGLPIPLLSTINPQRAQELIEKGWNSQELKFCKNLTISQSDLECIRKYISENIGNYEVSKCGEMLLLKDVLGDVAERNQIHFSQKNIIGILDSA